MSMSTMMLFPSLLKVMAMTILTYDHIKLKLLGRAISLTIDFLFYFFSYWENKFCWTSKISHWMITRFIRFLKGRGQGEGKTLLIYRKKIFMSVVEGNRRPFEWKVSGECGSGNTELWGPVSVWLPVKAFNKLQ